MIKKQLCASLLLVFVFSLSSCVFGKKKKEDIAQAEYKNEVLSSKEAVDFDYLYLDALKDKILGNYNQALSKFGQAMRINPRVAPLHYEMSSIYFLTGNTERAIISGEFAVRYDKNNKWYKMSLAELYMQGGKPEKALPIYQELVKEEPANSDYIFNMASIYAMMKRYDDAIKSLDRLEQILGINPETSDQKKSLYLKMNKTDKAIKEIEKLVASNPSEPNYLGVLAEIYAVNGMDEKAIEVYKRLIERDSTNAQVYFALADFYRNKREFDQSFLYLKKAFQNPFTPIDAKMGVLISFYDLSENNEKIKTQGYELCDLLINAHPDDAKGYSMLGDFLVRDQKYEEANVAFKKALDFDKSRYALWNQVILLASELEQTEQVYQLSKEATELFPFQPAFFLFNGISALQLKKYQEAVDVLKEGLVISIGNPTITEQMHATIGDSYQALKNFPASEEAYEKALKINPNNTYVLNNYAYYLSLRKANLTKAKQMAERVIALEPNNASYLDTYAWILFQAKEYKEALDWIERAIISGGASSAVILEHKGDIYFHLGEVEQAKIWWKKALDKEKQNKLLMKKIEDQKYYEEEN